MKYGLMFLLCLFVNHTALADAPPSYKHIIELKSTGHHAARKAIEPLYEDDINDIKHARSDNGDYLFFEHDRNDFLYIDTYDLNGDGNAEIFVHFISQYSCGSHGCSFSIYQKQANGEWQALCYMILYEGTGFAVSQNSTGQFHDVYVIDASARADTSAPFGVLKWDGKVYDYTILQKTNGQTER